MDYDLTGWRLALASVAGASHRSSGVGCQDACGRAFPYPGYLVAALADGAGSAKHAEAGAQQAAGLALEDLSDGVGLGDTRETSPSWRNLTLGIMKDARASIERLAARKNESIREYATTLIVVMATPNCVAAAQIGDGAVVVRPANGETFALTRPPNGDYLNETTFLTDANAMESIQFAFWTGKPLHIAAFTDGLQMLALRMPGAEPHMPFFDPLFEFAARIEDQDEGKAELTAFLQSDKVLSRTSDDLTLLVASLAIE